jgi:hypothetical protein
MKDKHRLNDKFIILASILNPETAEADAVVFARLKAARDALFHGEPTPESYPLDETQKILQMYLSLHLGPTGS